MEELLDLYFELDFELDFELNFELDFELDFGLALIQNICLINYYEQQRII